MGKLCTAASILWRKKGPSSILCVHTHCIGKWRYSIEAWDAALMLLSEDTKRVLFVLLHDILYTTGGTQPPRETTINWASSGAKWRTQYYAPTISVQVVVFWENSIHATTTPWNWVSRWKSCHSMAWISTWHPISRSCSGMNPTNPCFL